MSNGAGPTSNVGLLHRRTGARARARDSNRPTIERRPCLGVGTARGLGLRLARGLGPGIGPEGVGLGLKPRRAGKAVLGDLV